MKFKHHHRHGNVLFITLFTIGIIGIGIGSYLTLISQSNRAAMRSISWNAAIPIAEAGVEEALEHITWTGGSNLTANSWSLSGTNYTKNRTLSAGRYQVAVSSNSGTFVVQSTGYVPLPSGSSGEISRTVRAVAARRYTHRGFFFRDSVDLSSSVYIDSFDSSDPLYSTNGLYVGARAKANAVVASNSSTNTFKLWGNLTVKGRAAVGPGGTIVVGGSASVGDNSWSSKGIQTGHATDDANFDLPDVVLPTTVRYPPAAGVVGGTNYTYVLNGGDFQVSSLSAGQKVIVTASNTTIYVTGTFSPSAFVIQTNASVDIYLASSDPNLDPIQAMNNSTTACAVYGLPTVTTMTLGGFSGAVYAPSADISMSGNLTFTGAVAAKSLYLRGNVTFHYDEALQKVGGSTQGLVVTSWTEF